MDSSGNIYLQDLGSNRPGHIGTKAVPTQAGIIHQYISPTIFSFHLGIDSVAFRFLRQVGRDDIYLTTRELYLIGDLLKAVLTAGDQDDMQTLPGKLKGCSSANTTRGTSNDGDFVQPFRFVIFGHVE